MRLHPKTGLIWGMLLLLAGSSALAMPGAAGTPAPDFSLPIFGGGTYTLSENTGQVILMFVVGYG